MVDGAMNLIWNILNSVLIITNLLLIISFDPKRPIFPFSPPFFHLQVATFPFTCLLYLVVRFLFRENESNDMVNGTGLSLPFYHFLMQYEMKRNVMYVMERMSFLF